jgi:hypothetical protein
MRLNTELLCDKVRSMRLITELLCDKVRSMRLMTQLFRTLAEVVSLPITLMSLSIAPKSLVTGATWHVDAIAALDARPTRDMKGSFLRAFGSLPRTRGFESLVNTSMRLIVELNGLSSGVKRLAREWMTPKTWFMRLMNVVIRDDDPRKRLRGWFKQEKTSVMCLRIAGMSFVDALMRLMDAVMKLVAALEARGGAATRLRARDARSVASATSTPMTTTLASPRVGLGLGPRNPTPDLRVLPKARP